MVSLKKRNCAPEELPQHQVLSGSLPVRTVAASSAGLASKEASPAFGSLGGKAIFILRGRSAPGSVLRLAVSIRPRLPST